MTFITIIMRVLCKLKLHILHLAKLSKSSIKPYMTKSKIKHVHDKMQCITLWQMAIIHCTMTKNLNKFPLMSDIIYHFVATWNTVALKQHLNRPDSTVSTNSVQTRISWFIVNLKARKNNLWSKIQESCSLCIVGIVGTVL